MKCHSTWNVTQNGMSLNMECHSKWNVIKFLKWTVNGCERFGEREHNWVMHSQHYPAIDGVEIINI